MCWGVAWELNWWGSRIVFFVMKLICCVNIISMGSKYVNLTRNVHVVTRSVWSIFPMHYESSVLIVGHSWFNLGLLYVQKAIYLIAGYCVRFWWFVFLWQWVPRFKTKVQNVKCTFVSRSIFIYTTILGWYQDIG